MREDPQGGEDGSETSTRSGERDDGGDRDGDRRLTDIRADAVRPGDRVVYTSRLDKEYEFTVAEVDPPWLTFETGQMVHGDRFDREDFAVIRTATATEQVTARSADGPEPEEPASDPAAPSADGGDARSPNAD